ncbi:MAG: M48 family metallopeptidase, partial [Alphaproteobacteria bacterium]
GMVRFAEKDSELATVIGHEMAHNAMGHMDAKIGNFLFGTLFDILAAQAHSQSFEAEADYVGLYMTVLAGYEIENAPNFWRRMGVLHPGSIRANFSATHPSAPERFVALEQSVKEIRAKQAQGLPLVPDMKKQAAAEPAEPGSPEGN